MSLRGRLLRHRLPRGAVAATVLGLSLTLTASTVQSIAYAEDRGRGRPGVQDFGDPAEGTDAKAAPRPSDPARKAAVTGLDRASWPRQGSAEVAVAAAGSKKPAVATPGGLPVSVTAPQAPAQAKAGPAAPSAKASPATPGKVKVDVL
ncbi:hypothetical protein AB0R11_12660, partial [Streptomyces fradiae]